MKNSSFSYCDESSLHCSDFIIRMLSNIKATYKCIVYCHLYCKISSKTNIWICSVTEITPWRRSQNGLKEKYNRYVKVIYHNTHIFFVSPLRAKTYWNMICLSYLLSSIQERDRDHSLSILSWALIFMHQYFLSTMVFPAIVYY
mgnify:CR=1 FL=1